MLATDEHYQFPVLYSKGADGQKRIEATPDSVWEWKKPGHPPILEKAGYLLVSQGQRTSTARLTAVASENRYVGQGWMPVPELNAKRSKALAVFLNSTPGRLLVMRQPGKTLDFSVYSPAIWRDLPIPDMSDPHICDTLSACWNETRYELVPQFRDGYTEVRQRWDAAVSAALGWDVDELARLGGLLANEPHVRGVSYGQWKV